MTKARRVPLPDGTNIDDYAGWEAWDYRRWAWEYLRRNVSFRDACARVSVIKDKNERLMRKAEIAQKFMLKRYRHCDAPCEKRMPAFRAISPSPVPQSRGEVEWSTTLRHDQVAIVFNLRPALYSRSAIAELLASAKRSLEKNLESLKAIEADFKSHAQPQLDPEKHLRNLRLLDATAAGHDQIEIARSRWWREYSKDQPKQLVADAIRKALGPAKKLTEFGYAGIFSAPNRAKRMPVRPKDHDKQ